MKKALLTVSAFLLVLSMVISCSKSNPSGPQPTATNTPTATATQTGLFVEKAEIKQDQSSHGVGTAAAEVILRYGNASGAYVQGATITIGAATLSETSSGHYTATLSNIADGTTCNLSINSLAGNVNASVTSPYDGYVYTPSSSGGNQSAAAQLLICTDFCATTCPMPQSVIIYLWRSSDNVVYVNQTVTPPTGGNNYDTACWNVNANVLPTMGQIYIRFYSLNQSSISGTNGGSAMYRFLNSENTRYVNMTP